MPRHWLIFWLPDRLLRGAATPYGSAMSEQFEAAVTRVGQLTDDPGPEVKLKLYGLYKQATAGDVEGKRPGFTNPVGRAKYDAWAQCKGMSGDDAEAEYIEVVNGL